MKLLKLLAIAVIPGALLGFFVWALIEKYTDRIFFEKYHALSHGQARREKMIKDVVV